MKPVKPPRKPSFGSRKIAATHALQIIHLMQLQHHDKRNMEVPTTKNRHSGIINASGCGNINPASATRRTLYMGNG